MADVIDIKPHLPEGNAEIIESFRVLLAEAMNGRVTSFLTLIVDDGGAVAASYYFATEADGYALRSPMIFDEITQ